MTSRKIEAPVMLPDGLHTGQITNVDFKKVPSTTKQGEVYLYVDVYIEEAETKAIVKAGYPDKITPMTAFGRLIERFTGKPLDVGADIDVEKTLEGQPCTFQTTTTQKGEMKFCEVLKETLKRVEEEQVKK